MNNVSYVKVQELCRKSVGVIGIDQLNRLYTKKIFHRVFHVIKGSTKIMDYSLIIINNLVNKTFWATKLFGQ